ncbi:MAG: alpha-amylase family glycosyl hydrolase [Saprospiraceae bacterium]
MRLSVFPVIYNVYEVNIRQYTEEGTLDAFIAHLPRLKNMGVDVLWLMPVFPISLTRRKGTLGSYYAPSSYREINPNIGDKRDMKLLISKAHALGMRVILDWMTNHTGWDHEWITSHPEFYYKDENGHIREPFDANGKPMGWNDVAHLNYHNKDLWVTMISEMQYWVDEFRLDGFRQDMAMLVPTAFWVQANSQLRKSNPNLIFIAESEEGAHIDQGGFNVHYGWNLHHIINKVARKESGPSAVTKYIDTNLNGIQHKLLFTSNHDENSWSGSEILRMGEAYKAFAVLTYAVGGVPMIYSGQEEPNPKTIRFFDKDLIQLKHFFLQPLYSELNKARRSLLQHLTPSDHGQLEIHWYNSSVILAHQRVHSMAMSFLINISNQRQKITLQQNISGINIFSNENCNFDVGSSIELEPWNFIVITHNI